MYRTPTELSKLTIELTTDCNLQCDGCPRTISINHNNWENKHLSLVNFERIIFSLPKTGFVTLHGVGEPLLNPDFLEIVSSAKKSGKFGKMKITTNGLTRSAQFLQQAVKNGLDEIWVSVDSFDQIIADRLRAGTNIEKLKRNVADFITAGLPIHISMVIGKVNMFDYTNTLQSLLEIGNPIVHMQEYQDFGDPKGILDVESRKQVYSSFLEFKKRNNQSRAVPPLFFKPVQGTVCTAPWLRPAISVEGYLTPCCTTFDPSHFGYGSLIEHEFGEIWQSQNVQSWLASMANDDIEMCNGCGLNPKRGGLDVALNRSGKTGKTIHIVEIQ